VFGYVKPANVLSVRADFGDGHASIVAISVRGLFVGEHYRCPPSFFGVVDSVE
jgi:hypothetical protein